jgi:BMFP domain-containing protein YqiC
VTPDQVLQYLAVVGTLGAAYVAWRKASPERRRLGVEATGIAVTAQQQIIDDQQGYIVDLRAQIVEMKAEHIAEIDSVRRTFAAERETTRNEVVELREENERLQSRLYALEERLA